MYGDDVVNRTKNQVASIGIINLFWEKKNEGMQMWWITKMYLFKNKTSPWTYNGVDAI